MGYKLNEPNLTETFHGENARRLLPQYPQPYWTPLPNDILSSVERLEIYYIPTSNPNLASSRWEARAYDASGKMIGRAYDAMGDVGQDYVWDVCD
jgi:hypothetical protein